MFSTRVHRLSPCLLVLAIMLGLAMQGARAAEIGAAMAIAAASDAPMDHGCDGSSECECDDRMPASACITLCSGATAILPVPVTTPTPVAATIAERSIPQLAGCARPPDPYPPKPAVLS